MDIIPVILDAFKLSGMNIGIKQNLGGGVSVKVDMKETQYVPQVEKLLRNTLKNTGYYYASVKKLWGKTYLFNIRQKT